MVKLSTEAVENEIVKVIEQFKVAFGLDCEIDVNSSPGEIESISSLMLVTASTRVGRALGVTIPLGCYIFCDKAKGRQLTIREAAQKLIKEAKYGE
ncbi:MAG: hypothetical protein EOP56_07500 [Sphingobacteriales bacterium]|nr:MAG: hypothetical protein EOP56_07500 [Sphingobacteriales bacterium]